MMRILVAGATGYLGRFVAVELKRRGHSTRALARAPERLRSIEPDEVVKAEITRPHTLAHACDGIDAVFSSVGITHQRDGLTWKDVDYQGNLNLLNAATRAGVKRFVYVSVFDGPALRHLDIIRAHEDFVDALKVSDLEWVVIRPTGYFSDLEEIYRMAARGRVYLIGAGQHRVNPIHGADLAVVCADAIEGRRPEREIDVGGPRTFDWREIARLALAACGKPSRITSIPLWAVRMVTTLVRVFSRHKAELLRFFTTMATTDFVAPPVGVVDLEQHYRSLAGTEAGGNRPPTTPAAPPDSAASSAQQRTARMAGGHDAR